MDSRRITEGQAPDPADGVELLRWRKLALSIARDYYFPGADREDVEQEAMIGLWDAARCFRPGKGLFSAFAYQVIHRRLAGKVRAHTRLKHGPLTESSRFEDDAEESFFARSSFDPLAVVLAREEALEVLRRVREDLSPLQRRVLIMTANGKSQAEVAAEVGGSSIATSNGEQYRRYPRVYNALDRARKKLAA